jgi:hypothetical protein
MALKLGKRPAWHNEVTKRSGIAMGMALRPLGAAPLISNDYVSAVTAAVGADWGMFGNDEFSDCVQADDGHYLMVRTANAGSIVVPTLADILALYGAETGFNQNDPSTDQGTVEFLDCQYMVTSGLLGHKANATGYVDPNDLNHLRWCIQLFGGCKFGVNLPQSAMDQFNDGQPWTVLFDDGGIIGGHDVLGVRYDSEWFHIVTWGSVWKVAPSWILKYADEAHALLFADWIEENGAAPNGFNLKKLLTALGEIEYWPTGVGNHRMKRHRRQHRRHKHGN